MNMKIKPASVAGKKIQAPASKSSMQRACAAALVKKGISFIHNAGISNDDKAALDIIQRLGATVVEETEVLTITSSGVKPKEGDVNCGESGLSIRMFTPIVALSSDSLTINGAGSLLGRPMNFFDEILPALGVAVQSVEGKLPIQVKGPLKPGNITVDGSLSSQFLTGLLLAYAAATTVAIDDPRNGDIVEINVTELKSRPYIDLTLNVMRHFGLNVPVNENYEKFVFTFQHIASKTVNYVVEGDWSGGAFLLVAGAIAGPVEVSGLDINSTQADSAIIQALETAGAVVAYDGKVIRVDAHQLLAFEFDATHCPDLFPPLVVLAAYCKGISRIKGVSRLTHKESDRRKALTEEFGKMGVEIVTNGDYMEVHGGGIVKGALTHAHHDHRIAMACAIAALKAEGETTIEGAWAVKKSYPEFYNDLQKMGVIVEPETLISSPFQKEV